eukprot:scaffold1397_cov254-Pinguiococcus_pyrenoidosus.AAC.48
MERMQSPLVELHCMEGKQPIPALHRLYQDAPSGTKNTCAKSRGGQGWRRSWMRTTTTGSPVCGTEAARVLQCCSGAISNTPELALFESRDGPGRKLALVEPSPVLPTLVAVLRGDALNSKGS